MIADLSQSQQQRQHCHELLWKSKSNTCQSLLFCYGGRSLIYAIDGARLEEFVELQLNPSLHSEIVFPFLAKGISTGGNERQ